MSTLKALWKDDAGVIISTELVLVITILGLGTIVGLSSVRNAVVAELADVADAVNNIDQSYSYASVTGHESTTSGSNNADAPDFCDNGTGGSDNSACVVVGGATGADTGK